MKNQIIKTKAFLLLIASIIVLNCCIPITARTSNMKQIKIISEAQISTSDQAYDLLIITPTSFRSPLDSFIDHKNAINIETHIVTLDTIYQETSNIGRDNAEKIKYYIKNAIEKWGISYVLFVGGKRHQGLSWHIPVRYVAMNDGWESHYLTDLYFADIYDAEGNFSTWNSNNNALFGEWGEDGAIDKNIDLLPDVAVGRLPVRNSLEVIIMTQKIIQYERSTYNQPWFKKVVLIAGDTYPEYQNPNWTGYEGEEYADKALSYLTSFNPIKLYTSDGSLTGPEVVVETITQGCGLLYFVGHGNPMSWANHPPNQGSFITGLGIEHMPKLKNMNKLPICVVSGCHNSQFDVSIFKVLDPIARYRGECTPECWSWWLTRKIGGGAIATLGCTALGYTKEDKDSFDGGLNWVEVEFFRQYGQGNISIIGDIWMKAITEYVLNFPPISWDDPVLSDSFIDVKVPQSFILFGDPSMTIGGLPT